MKSTTNKSILLAQVQVAIAMLDMDFNYLEVSERWLSDFGLQGKDIIGLNHLITFPDRADAWQKIFSSCLKGNTVKKDEELLLKADGKFAWFRWDVRPWQDEEGYIGGLVFCSEDITEQKKTEDELKKTLEMLEATNKVARIGVWEVDLITRTAYWSPVTKEIHEVEQDYRIPDIDGAISFYKEGENRSTITRLVTEAIENGTSFDDELLLITAKRNERWVHVKGGATIKNGKAIRLFGTFQDIHEKKTQSIQLEESEKKYRSIVANSIHAFIISTIDGKMLDANTSALQMFGYSSEEFINISRGQILEETDHFKELVAIRNRTGKTKGEATCIRKDGTTFPCEFSSVLFTDNDGQQRSSTIIIDLSERKKLEEESIQLLNNTEECFVLVSKDLKIVTFNKQFGLHYQKLLKKQVKRGDSILDYVQPERVEIVKALYMRILQGEEVVTEITIPGEHPYIYSNHYKPAYDDNGSIYGAFVTSKDITEEKKTKEQIEENERRFRSLVENSGDAIAILTPEAKVVYISPSVEKILGYTEEDMYTTDLISLIHPQDVAAKAEKLQQVMASPGVPIKEVIGRMKHKDGSWRWIEATMTNMLHEPNINGIIDNFKDITHKKELEQDREFEKRNKEALINSTSDLIWSVDLEYRLIAANNAFLDNIETMVGCFLKPGDDLLKIPGISDDFVIYWREMYNKVLGGVSFSTEFYTPEIGGNPPNWSEVTLNPILDGDTIVGIACFGKIITESKRIETLHILEKEVLESYTTNKTSLYDTIVYLIEGIEKIHPEMKCSVLKLTEGRLYNSAAPSLPIEYLTAIDGFESGIGMGSCGTAAASKEKVIVSDIATDPLWENYKELPLKFNLLACWSFPIIDSGNNVLGTFGIYYNKIHAPRKDEEETLERARTILTTIIENQIAQEAIMLSEQRLKESETALKILNTELEQRVSERTAELVNVNRQLESFSYSVSHDLRSPLRSIHGFSQLLNRRLSDSLSQENMELLALIQSNTVRMENLIEDILEFSRISKLNTNKRVINTNELVEDVWQNLNIREGINAALTIDELPEITADKAMLTQVFVNLLSNAVKYSAKKERADIEVGASVSERSITYFVKDNGAGFNMKHYDKLFAAFQRLHSPIDFEGTGVGLAIVKSIIEKHDGRIWAEGKENEGATFFFELPYTSE